MAMCSLVLVEAAVAVLPLMAAGPITIATVAATHTHGLNGFI
jgi:hypothetical protein